MTDILIYVEAACIIIGRFLILYAAFCVAKTLWKQFRHTTNKIYSHVTGDAESLFPKKQCICQVRKSEMAEIMSKKSEEGFIYKESLPGEDDDTVILVFEKFQVWTAEAIGFGGSFFAWIF